MQMVRSATEKDLTRITQAYVDAARILVSAGFDVLELHMAHSYLISSFLAPGLNRRKDEYGGVAGEPRQAGAAGRARRPRRGRRLRRRSPRRSAVSDGFKGGVRTEDSIEFAQMLEADGCLDALQLSGGCSLMNPMYLFRGDVPQKEFAATMPPLVRFGMKTPMGKGFLKHYDFEEALLLRQGLAVPRGARDAADAARRHQPARPRWRRRWRPASTSSRWAARCCASRTWSTSSRPGRQKAAKCIHCNRCMPTIYSGTRCPEIPVD